MSKNENFNFEPFKALFEKVSENRPLIKSNFILCNFFIKCLLKAQNRFFLLFVVHFKAYFEKNHKIRFVPNSKLVLVTIQQNL